MVIRGNPYFAVQTYSFSPPPFIAAGSCLPGRVIIAREHIFDALNSQPEFKGLTQISVRMKHLHTNLNEAPKRNQPIFPRGYL